MKALLALFVLGALCPLAAIASASGRTSRLLELYPFDSSIAVSPPGPLASLKEAEAVEWKEMEPLGEGLRLGKRLSLVPVDEDDLFELRTLDTRGDLLPNSLLKAYRGGFTVRLPGASDTMTVYIRSGLSWDVGKNRRLIFPYVSRHIGFRYKWQF